MIPWTSLSSRVARNQAVAGELAVICTCTHARGRHKQGVCQADMQGRAVWIKCDCVEFVDRGPIDACEPTPA